MYIFIYLFRKAVRYNVSTFNEKGCPSLILSGNTGLRRAFCNFPTDSRVWRDEAIFVSSIFKCTADMLSSPFKPSEPLTSATFVWNDSHQVPQGFCTNKRACTAGEHWIQAISSVISGVSNRCNVIKMICACHGQWILQTQLVPAPERTYTSSLGFVNLCQQFLALVILKARALVYLLNIGTKNHHAIKWFSRPEINTLYDI